MLKKQARCATRRRINTSLNFLASFSIFTIAHLPTTETGNCTGSSSSKNLIQSYRYDAPLANLKRSPTKMTHGFSISAGDFLSINGLAIGIGKKKFDRFHAAICRFPFIVGRVADAILMAEVFYFYAGIGGFENLDNLLLSEA
jgi:hypothetical protein